MPSNTSKLCVCYQQRLWYLYGVVHFRLYIFFAKKYNMFQKLQVLAHINKESTQTEKERESEGERVKGIE